ncbi:NAD-dependent epimerase/dehydratase family protein, partial [Microvirga sp. 3-52]|nr:NAD-dependent epimerase/dehydratase family protein [Microvirga sp. 3-52]
SDFLGKTVHDWEQKALSAEKDGLRVVCTRFGVVLSLDGGAFPLMALPYKLFAGGTVGTGKQWVSWVHINDVARAILFAIENRNLSGPVNVTAPSPKRMKEFGQTIGAVLRRP